MCVCSVCEECVCDCVCPVSLTLFRSLTLVCVSPLVCASGFAAAAPVSFGAFGLGPAAPGFSFGAGRSSVRGRRSPSFMIRSHHAFMHVCLSLCPIRGLVSDAHTRPVHRIISCVASAVSSSHVCFLQVRSEDSAPRPPPPALGPASISPRRQTQVRLNPGSDACVCASSSDRKLFLTLQVRVSSETLRTRASASRRLWVRVRRRGRDSALWAEPDWGSEDSGGSRPIRTNKVRPGVTSVQSASFLLRIEGRFPQNCVFCKLFSR